MARVRSKRGILFEERKARGHLKRSGAQGQMTTKQKSDEKPGVSKVQLAVGAASLFLFIVGLKRTFRVDEERQKLGAPDSPEPQKSSGRTRKP